MQTAAKNSWLSVFAGLLFAIFWGSGSTITKLGLQYLQPWVIAVCRLFTATAIMLVIAHVILKYPLPQKKHLKSIAIYGFFNLSVFLGMYTYALQFVPGGLGTLMTAVTPIFITLLINLSLKKKISGVIIFSLLLCLLGVFITAWPVIYFSKAPIWGMLILLIGIISNATGAVYFVRTDWDGINLLTINAWQTLLGALFLLPLCLYYYDGNLNNFTYQAIISVGWLAIFLSTTAILLWLFILRQNPVRAAFWLFLCPIVGFALASILLHEPITYFTIIGITLVVSGLYISQRNA